MGFVGDALAFASDNEALLAAVVTTVGTWLGARAVTRTKVRVKWGDNEIEIDSGSPGKAAEIAARIVADLDREPRRKR